ncbi:hypothetical protein AK812_SmicGene16653 [Symbiodinium microadriaticum]|uniref:Uncharacterized protein n=1 Tax=Symbiodinium microadriaticum TaxID=2951 RepID=A0A1Q9DZR4_SYMMI|nr:hypothetical protein AK812_SmicGene16653 [Symbiodinium microadriaticum]
MPCPGTLPSQHEDRSVSKNTVSSQLEPDLLRGLPLHEALSAWGHHWRNDVTPMSYALSRPTNTFDGFLSHDWASSGWLKFLSLLIIFNSGAAFWSCLVVSVLVGILRGYGCLPDEHWTVAFGHFIYFFVFFFWQRLQMPCRQSRMMFLDKVCVAQHDDELKHKAIMGLAAFLLNSQELIVLLSSRYFTRLWCVFEIATFMKDPERRKRIRLMPLKSTVLLLLVSGCWYLLNIGFNTTKLVFWDYNSSETESSFVFETVAAIVSMFIFCFVLLPVAFYVGMEMSEDMEVMPQQLRNFRVQDAKCLCCSIDHRDPITGARLPCDREVLYATMKEWYGGDAAGDEGDYLETFSTLVREKLAARVEFLVGGFTLPMKYLVYMVVGSSVPYLADHVALAISWFPYLSGFDLFAWMLRDLVDWGMAPVTSLLTAQTCLPLLKLGLQLRWNDSKCCRWSIAFLLTFVMSIFGSLIWAPTHVTFATIDSASP